MKTAGELLQESRLKQKKTISEIALLIKIKPEYLRAIEKNAYHKLPSATFTKGFLRKYASQIGVNPDTVIAMFRRDFIEDDKGQIIPKGLVDPVGKKRQSFPINVVIGIIATTTFLSFFGWQLYNYFSLPKLEILQPVDGETYTAKITVKGKTSPDNTVEINNQKVVVGPGGEFSLDLIFTAGTHAVVIEAVNRQNKSRLLQRTFQISK